MSTLTDERVVQMKFDNKQFNKNVKKSTSIFEKFKNSLNLSSSAKSVNKALEDTQTNTNGISSAVQNVTAKFSLWEKVALSVVNRITNRVIDLGERMVKSLSVDNISDGWTKFNDNVRLQSTLLAQGFEQANIDSAIKKLEAYSDATSYSATSMTNAMQLIANSTEMSLGDASSLVTGFANQMAAAGATIYEFSGASNMLTKAISQGYLSGIAFKSLNETYKIITNEFKDQAVQAALANGTLIKTGEDLYRGMNSETEYTMKQLFSEGLTAEKWLTTDVMQNMYSSYAFASDQLNQLADSTNKKFYDLVNEFAAYDDEELTKALKDRLGITDELEISMFKLSLNSLKAAQECRSLSDAFNAIKDAVSSGWKKSFQYIIGDVNETKELWSNVYDALDGIFINDELRNAALEQWNILGGQADLFDKETGALFQLLGAVQDITDVFRSTFNEVFFGSANPEASTVANIIKSVTNYIQKASVALRTFVQNNLSTIHNVLKVIFNLVKIGGTAIKFVWNIIKRLIKSLSPLQKLLGGGSKGLATLVEKLSNRFSKWTTNSNLITRTIDKLGSGVNKLVGKLKKLNVLDKIVKTFKTLWDNIKGVAHSIENTGSNFTKSMKSIQSGTTTITDAISKVFGKKTNKSMDTTANTGKKTESTFDKIFGKLLTVMKNTVKLMGTIIYNLLSLLNFFIKGFDKFINKFSKIIKTISLYFELFAKAFTLSSGAKPEETIEERNKRIMESLQPLVDFLKSLKTMCDGVLSLLTKVLTQLGNKLKEVEDPIGKAKAAVAKIKSIFVDLKNWASEHEDITVGLIALAGLILIVISFLTVFMTLNGKLKVLSKAALQYAKALKWKAIAEFIKAIATLIATITASIVLLGALPLKQLIKGTSTMIFIASIIFAMTAGMSILAGAISKANNLAGSKTETTFGKKGSGLLSRTHKEDPVSTLLGNMAYFMMKLSMSMIGLTAAIYLLGHMDKNVLKRGGATLAIIVTSVVGITAVMLGLSVLANKSVKRGESNKIADIMGEMTTYISKIGISMIWLSAALFLLSKLKPETYLKGLAMMSGLLIVISVAIRIMNASSKITKTNQDGSSKTVERNANSSIQNVAKQILTLSISMIGLMAACHLLNTMSWSDIKKSAVMLPVLSLTLIAISLSIALTNKTLERLSDEKKYKSPMEKLKGFVKNMLSLITGISLVFAMTRLILKIKGINLKGAKELIVSLGVVSSFLLSVAAAMRLTTMILGDAFGGSKKNTKGMEKWKKSLLAIGSVLVTIVLLAPVMALLAQCNPVNLLAAATIMTAMAGIFIVMAQSISASTKIMNNLKTEDLSKIVTITGSLVVIGAMMAIFGQMNIKTILKGTLAIGLALVLLIGAVASLAVIGKIVGKATLAIVSLNKLIPSLIIIGALMALFGQMKVKTILKGVMGLVAALGVMVAAVAVLALLSSLAGPLLIPLGALSIVILSLATAFLEFAIAMALLANTDMSSLASSLSQMCDAILTNSNKIKETMKVLFTGILEAILFALISIRTDLKQFITDTLKDMLTNVPEWAGYLMDIIIGILKAVEDRAREVSNRIMGILIEFIKGLTDRIDELVHEVFNFFETFWKSVIHEFEAITPSWLKKLWTKLKEAVKNSLGELKVIGKQIFDGILEGLESAADFVTETAKKVCDKVKNGIKKIFGIHSPSRVMRDEVGVYITEGIAEGMKETDSITDANNAISNAILDGIDDDLTITPVLDLSEIQNGINQMDSMMTDNYTIGTATAQAANSSFNRRTADGQYSSSSITNSNDQYTINNVFNVTENVDPDELADSVMKSLNDRINARNSFRATKRYV